jgi:multiple sugar transport system permease protein
MSTHPSVEGSRPQFRMAEVDVTAGSHVPSTQRTVGGAPRSPLNGSGPEAGPDSGSRRGFLSWITRSVNSRLDRMSERRFATVLFMPGLIIVGLVAAPPVVAVFVTSLFRIELLKDDRTPFVGLRNFLAMPGDANFLASIPRTLYFAIAITALTIPLGLAAAMVLNRKSRGNHWLGLAVLMPWAVAPIVTGLYWRYIFQPEFGLATGIAYALGLTRHPIDWLDNTQVAIGVAIVAIAWRSVPLIALLLLAALKSIPFALYSAAKMDGATAWQRFRYVTLPGIRNMLLVVTILTIVGALQTFDIIFTLTHGGPGYDTTVIYYYIYTSAFGTLSFGYAAALTVFLVALIFVFVAPLVYLRQRRSVPIKDEAARAEAQMTAPNMNGLASRADVLTTRNQARLPLVFHRRKRFIPSWLPRTFGIAGAAVLVIWLVGPVVWILIASVEPTAAITHAPPQLTLALTLDHYKQLLQDPGWGHSILVSLQVAIFTAAATLLLSVLAAYPMARLDVPGKGPALIALLTMQMLPAISLAIPVLLLFRTVHLEDTVAALVIVNTAYSTPLAIWILRNVFEEVPRALEVAARIDGCSRLGALFRITIPAAAPGIAAVAILLLISAWNEFLFAVVLGFREAVTVTRQIGFIETPHSMGNSYPYAELAAGGFLAVLPCLLLVVFFQRRVIAGLTQGYVKG